MFQFKKLRDFLKDVRNFFRIWKIIKRNQDTADWGNLNFRVDWVCRIYTVFNPAPGDKGDDPKMLEIKMTERTIPYHRYVESIGLSEYVRVSVEKIPDSESYLLVYYPLFRYITTFRILLNTLLIVLIIILGHHIENLFKWMWSLVF
jgi:hypothetical protein